MCMMHYQIPTFLIALSSLHPSISIQHLFLMNSRSQFNNDIQQVEVRNPKYITEQTVITKQKQQVFDLQTTSTLFFSKKKDHSSGIKPFSIIN
jgi:hypothetical protein